jgi:hypothetical protein
MASSLSDVVATGAQSFLTNSMFCGGAGHLRENRSLFRDSIHALRG